MLFMFEPFDITVGGLIALGADATATLLIDGTSSILGAVSGSRQTFTALAVGVISCFYQTADSKLGSKPRSL
jgi:hypothetical protein